MCTQKLTSVSLIYHTEQKNKKWKKEKLKSKKWICSVSVNSPVNPWKYVRKDLQERKILSLEWKSEGVMDDESGESMEPTEEVPLIRLGESQLERWVHGWWWEKPGVDSRDEGKPTERNNLLFVEKMNADRRASVTKDEERVLRAG